MRNRIALLEPSVASECVVTEMMGQIRAGAPFLAGALTAQGFEVRIFAEEIITFDALLMDRLAREYDGIGLSLTLNTLPRGLQVAKALKKRRPELPIVAGGPSASAFADTLLTVCDAVFKGRSEVSLPDYFRAVFQGLDLEQIPGIVLRRDGKIVRNRLPVQTANALCRYDLVEGFGRFTCREGLFGYRKPAVYSLFASTGCVRSCRFCKSEKRYLARPHDQVIADLTALLKLHDSRRLARFLLVDDCLFADLDATKELLRRIEQATRGHHVSFSAQFHVQPTADNELMNLFKKARFSSLALGFETVSQASLDHERKGTTVLQNDQAIAQCRRFGIVPYGYFIVGFDSDEEQTVQDVFDYILNRKLIAQVLPVGLMNRDDDGEPTSDAPRVLSDTSFGATVFVSHRPKRIRADRLQMMINRGYDRISSLKRMLDFHTQYEREFLFGMNRSARVWRPAMRAHAEYLGQISP